MTELIKNEFYTENMFVTQYRRGGVLHRTDGPAVIKVGKISNQLLQEIWFNNGAVHRDNDKPAHILWNGDQTVIQKRWFKHGLIHRLSAPAMIFCHSDGRIFHSEWYVNGEEINPVDFPSIDFNSWPLSPDDQIKLKLMISGR